MQSSVVSDVEESHLVSEVEQSPVVGDFEESHVVSCRTILRNLWCKTVHVVSDEKILL